LSGKGRPGESKGKTKALREKKKIWWKYRAHTRKRYCFSLGASFSARESLGCRKEQGGYKKKRVKRVYFLDKKKAKGHRLQSHSKKNPAQR